MKIERINITEQIVDYLKENIQNGNWLVGEKIPSENQLVEILGVSRTSIRTAVQQLIGIGALESRHGMGTFVRCNDLTSVVRRFEINEEYSDVKKVLEFRLAIEPEICLLATERITLEALGSLTQLLTAMQESVGNQKEFVQYDIQFHKEIGKASRNKLLEGSLLEVFDQTVADHEQINDVFGYKDGIYYHKQIMKAMQNGQSAKAKQLMYQHLKHAYDLL